MIHHLFDEAGAGKEQYASVLVYINQDEFAIQGYGICVDRFDLAKSDGLLSSLFA